VVPTYVNARTMEVLLEALGSDASICIVAWHTKAEMKAHREELLEHVELALTHALFREKRHGTNWHYAKAALNVVKEEMTQELLPSSTYSIFDALHVVL
jgi:hypothetical protein